MYVLPRRNLQEAVESEVGIDISGFLMSAEFMLCSVLSATLTTFAYEAFDAVWAAQVPDGAYKTRTCTTHTDASCDFQANVREQTRTHTSDLRLGQASGVASRFLFFCRRVRFLDVLCLRGSFFVRWNLALPSDSLRLALLEGPLCSL